MVFPSAFSQISPFTYIFAFSLYLFAIDSTTKYDLSPKFKTQSSTNFEHLHWVIKTQPHLKVNELHFSLQGCFKLKTHLITHELSQKLPTLKTQTQPPSSAILKPLPFTLCSPFLRLLPQYILSTNIYRVPIRCFSHG